MLKWINLGLFKWLGDEKTEKLRLKCYNDLKSVCSEIRVTKDNNNDNEIVLYGWGDDWKVNNFIMDTEFEPIDNEYLLIVN